MRCPRFVAACAAPPARLERLAEFGLAPGAIGDLSLELAAGGVDVVAAGAADRRDHACVGFAGQSFIVNYTIDMQGQIKDIWVLTDEEIARLWPTSREQAASWRFDPGTQTWAKP